MEDSRHASGQWLYRSHSEEHRCVPGRFAVSISGPKSQRRGFQSGGQRLCENQHTPNKGDSNANSKKITNIIVRLFDVKSSQHVLSDYDTIVNVNEFLEKCKCIPSMVAPATDFWEICRSKPHWVTLATPTLIHGAKISFVS